MAALLIPLGFQPQDGNGKPHPGAKMYVYTAGTTTPVTVYEDNALSSAHANPVVADANGVFPAIYCNPGSYKIKIDTSADVQFLLQDNYAAPIPSDNGTVALLNGGTGAANATDARTNLGAASAADVTTLSTDVADVKGQVDALPGGALGDAASQDTIGFDYFASNLTPVLQVEDNLNQFGETNIMTDTDGTSRVTKNFTPKRATSSVTVWACGTCVTGSDATETSIGVFTSASSSALHAIKLQPNDKTPWTLMKTFLPGSTSLITISVRSNDTVKDLSLTIIEHEAT